MAEYLLHWEKKLQDRKAKLQKRKVILRDLAFKCASLLKSEFNVKKVFLIGSLTKDRIIDEKSDIDLAVKGLKDEDYFPALGKLYEMVDKRSEIDLITMESAKSSMLKKIEANGEEL